MNDDSKDKHREDTKIELKQSKSFQEKKMLTNKQNKDVVNKQELTYTELKMSKSQQKQKTPKKNQSNVISSEQVTYVEIKFPRTSHLQRRKQLFRKNRKVLDHQSTAWQVVTASLGILCVALMTTVGVLLANLFSSREDQNQKISPVPTLSSEDDKCSYDLCSTDWIGFGNSYYCLFNKPKTWAESHVACAELNSHLLKLDIKEELVRHTLLCFCYSITIFIYESLGD